MSTTAAAVMLVPTRYGGAPRVSTQTKEKSQIDGAFFPVMVAVAVSYGVGTLKTFLLSWVSGASLRVSVRVRD